MLAHENPFATKRVETLLTFDPALSGTSWDAIEQRWEELNHRAAIIGPHGAGKTSLLDAFARRFEDQSHKILRLFLNTSQKRFSNKDWENLTHCQDHIVILDGEEQLGFMARYRFYRLTKSAKGLIITRHSKGKLPILMECHPTMEILEHCVRKLSPEHFREFQPHLETWWEIEQGNIRHILLRCYDHCRKSSLSTSNQVRA